HATPKSGRQLASSTLSSGSDARTPARVALASTRWPPAENPTIPIFFGSMPHSVARLRTRLTARWASSWGPSGGSPLTSPGRRGRPGRRGGRPSGPGPVWGRSWRQFRRGRGKRPVDVDRRVGPVPRPPFGECVGRQQPVYRLRPLVRLGGGEERGQLVVGRR